MTRYAALLRAVNVGGTGKLAMAELRAIAENCGFVDVFTYIASGNLLLSSGLAEREVKAQLEAALADRRRPTSVLVRTGAELAEVLAANPFAGEAGNRTVVIFLDEPPPAGALADVRGVGNERMALGSREIYVVYGEGMADFAIAHPRGSERHGQEHQHRGQARRTRPLTRLSVGYKMARSSAVCESIGEEAFASAPALFGSGSTLPATSTAVITTPAAQISAHQRLLKMVLWRIGTMAPL